MTSQTRWAFHLPDWKPTLQTMNLVSRCIQHEERSRISKFYFQRDAKASLVGRLMMRKYCSEKLNHRYDTLKFIRDENNKPTLEMSTGNANDTKKIFFNVSHQGDYVVLAGSTSSNVGVDVMKVEHRGSEIQEFFRLMTRQFSPYEWSRIRSYESDTLQLKAFIRNWSLKESYVKAVGTGIVFALDRIDFIIKSEIVPNSNHVIKDTQVKIDKKLLDDWTFEESMLDDEHVVAVALNSTQEEEKESESAELNSNLKFKFINFEELVSNAVPFGDSDDNFCTDFLQKQYSPSMA